MSALSREETADEISEHHHELHKKIHEQRRQPVAPPPIPPAPQHTVVGLNCFNATAKISNSNWETKLSDEVTLNEGDSIFVKNAYIDTRNQTSQNILIEEDTIIEMEYFFYYVNRGGTNTPSIWQDYGTTNPLILQQTRAQEYRFVESLPAFDTQGYTSPIENLDSTIVPIVIIDPTKADQQTIENLAKVTETIYYAPNNFPAPDANATAYLNTYTKAQLRTNPMAFIMPQAINAVDGLPYLLKIAKPDILPPPAVPVPFPNFSIYWDVNNNVLVDTFSAKGTWSAQPSPPSLPSSYLQQWTDAGFQQQLNIGISWDLTTGDYYLVEGLVIANGIALGQTFTIKGSAFGLIDGLNDCILTVNLVVPAPAPIIPAGSGYPASPPLSAVNFTVFGNTSYYPPPNPLYKPTTLVPFTKKFKLLIPAGSYSPDYMATYVSRGMAIQKQKIQRDYTTDAGYPAQSPIFSSLVTPIQPIGSQFAPTLGYGVTDFPPEEGAYNCPDLPIGTFSTDEGPYYQPSLQYMSKNPKSYPNPPSIPFNDAPFDPDFNSPYYNDNDDQPFLFQPKVFTNEFQLNTINCGFVTTYVPPKQTSTLNRAYNNINFRLALNDSNLQDYNRMPAEVFRNGNSAIDFDPTIDMMYTPFLSDVQSPFYYVSEGGFNSTVPPLSTLTPPDMNYGIRPIISTMSLLASAEQTELIQDFAHVLDFSTPIVGASEMALTWNDEGSNLFALPFLHNPLYSKPDPTTDQVQASVAKIPSGYCFGQTTNSANTAHLVKGIVQCDRQSGILLKSMTSKTRSGKNGLFWEKLGFVPADICVKVDASGNPICDYRTFIAKTTGGFSGTANIYNPAYNMLGSGEICYAPVEDMTSVGGWYGGISYDPLNPNNINNNFLPNFNTIYYTVENTNSIYAKSAPQNPNDCGHVLIELQAWNMAFINETDYKQVKAVVSNYFISANSFVSQIGPESFVYYHLGNSLTISTVKVRILNPKTLEEYPLLGPNSSVYVQFVRQPTQSNIIVGPSL